MRALRMSAATLIALGVASVTLAAGGSKTATPLTTEKVGQREASLPDLVTDAVLRASHAQAALICAAQFKAGPPIPAGKVTATQIVGLLVKPEREWLVSNISGKGLREALERSLSRVPGETAYFLQVAGLQVEFDPQGSAGHRITKLLIGGVAVVEATSYEVAMTDDLAKGGSGYFVVPDFSEKNVHAEPTGTLETAISALLGATPELDYGTLNRVVAATH